MDLRSLAAKDIMTRDITVISPKEKVTIAEIMMIRKNIGGLPVISPETQEIIGMLTQRDIQLSRSTIGTHVFHVDDIYSRNPIVGKETDPLPEIIKKMVDHNIERIPITDTQNKVIGIIVMKDIIHTLGNYFNSQDP